MAFAFDVTSNIPRLTQSGTDTGLGGIATAINAVATVARSVSVAVGQIRKPPAANGMWYRCTTAGTTAATAPLYNASEGSNTTDGTAVFNAFLAPIVRSLGTSNHYFMPAVRVQITGALTNANIQQQNFTCLDLFVAGASANFISGQWANDGVTPLWDGVHFTAVRSSTSGALGDGMYLQAGAQFTFIGGEVQTAAGVTFDAGTTPRCYLTRWRNTKEYGGSSARFRSSTTEAIFQDVEAYDFAFDLFRMPTNPPSIRARGSEYTYQYVGSAAGGIDAKFAASNLENPNGAYDFDNWGCGWVELYNCKQGAELNVFSQQGATPLRDRHCVPLYQDLIITARDTSGVVVPDVRFTATESPTNSPTITITTNGNLKTWDFRNPETYETTTDANGVATSSPVLNVWYFQGSFKESLRFPASTAVYQGRSYNYKTMNVSVLLGASAAIPVSAGMVALDTATTVTETAALALTGITLTPSGLTSGDILVSSNMSLQTAWNYYRAYISQFENFSTSTDTWSFVGGKLNFGNWNLTVATGVTLSSSEAGQSITTLGTVTNNGTIGVPYQDVLGSRVLVSGLDPQGFGVTWNIRYKVIGETTWTELTGTGNTTVILADNDEYRLQARVAGYTWKEIEFDTNIILSVDLALQYHVADDGSPQYLKPYNATLVDSFEYNDAAMEVEVTNTTGSIVQPGFPELYQVVEKVQQDPTLVWFWVNPVTTNATSQKVLIPPTSPLRMYLSVDSTASVKITCPVVYSDTGISADDRVKGNPSGFSIILGSSATADSSLIVSQLVEQLGGSGYVTNQNSLKKISDKAESLQNYDDTALKAKVDATLKAADYVAPDNTKIDQIKTKVDTLENYDDSALTAKVDATLKAVDYVAPDNTKIAQIKTKVDTLENYDDTALTAKVDATLKAVDYVAPDNAKIAQIKSIVEDKTGYSLTSAQVEAIAVAVESHLLDEGDGQMLLNAIAQAIGNENIDQIALVAAIRADMERSGGKITQIQTKVDTLVNYDDTALEAKVDATLKAADYVIPDNDTVTMINTKLDELAGDEYDPATDSIKKIKDGLSVVNNGVKKASLEIPHTDSI